MKKKLIRRMLALLLLCILCLPTLFACAAKGTEEIPDGMQMATCHGADFRLFIPTHWNLNTAYGISGGYYNLAKQSTVSVTSFPITEGMLDEMRTAEVDTAKSEAKIKWFFETYLKVQVSAVATGGVKMHEDECVATLLDDVNAWQFRYSAVVGGDELELLQIVCERKNAFYLFSLVATKELYALFGQDIAKMLECFYFSDTPYSAAYLKELDENAEAPEGMRLASNNDVAYLFYVPATWQVSFDEEIFSAFVEADRSSVSIVPYMPTGQGISIIEYFAESEAMMKKISGGKYTLHDSKQVQLGGKNAMQYEYSLTLGGISYRYRQLITSHAGMLYNLTYTSTEENFETHLQDLDKIVQAFQFR